MEVICEQCKAKLNIPDEKIPKDQVIKIGCPKCKNKITIDTRSPQPEAAPPAPAEKEGHDETGKSHLKSIDQKAGEKPAEQAYGYSDYSSDEGLEFFDRESKLALILAAGSEQAGKMKSAVEKLGYKQAFSPNTRDAIGKMRFHNFDLIILAEGFDGQAVEQSPIINYLNRISISVRRKIFLALVGDQFKTTDNMMAFALSANTVVSSKDVDNLYGILKSAITDHERFYKVYLDTMVELGKA